MSFVGRIVRLVRFFLAVVLVWTQSQPTRFVGAVRTPHQAVAATTTTTTKSTPASSNIKNSSPTSAATASSSQQQQQANNKSSSSSNSPTTHPTLASSLFWSHPTDLNRSPPTASITAGSTLSSSSSSTSSSCSSTPLFGLGQQQRARTTNTNTNTPTASTFSSSSSSSSSSWTAPTTTIRGGSAPPDAPPVLEATTAAQVEAAILRAGSEQQLVVIDFTASWCGPCKVIAPVFHELAEATPDVVFIKVDVDEIPETAAKYNVSAMPTFVFIKGGEVVDRLMGANPTRLQELIDEHK